MAKNEPIACRRITFLSRSVSVNRLWHVDSSKEPQGTLIGPEQVVWRLDGVLRGAL